MRKDKKQVDIEQMLRERKVRPTPVKPCKVTGCGNLAFAEGKCGYHLIRIVGSVRW